MEHDPAHASLPTVGGDMADGTSDAAGKDEGRNEGRRQVDRRSPTTAGCCGLGKVVVHVEINSTLCATLRPRYYEIQKIHRMNRATTGPT